MRRAKETKENSIMDLLLSNLTSLESNLKNYTE
jgi:hypothetical protein